MKLRRLTYIDLQIDRADFAGRGDNEQNKKKRKRKPTENLYTDLLWAGSFVQLMMSFCK
jgi:hypothetical protein